jgi:hypothetical protein
MDRRRHAWRRPPRAVVQRGHALLYEDGAKARAFLGDGGGERAQVALLDAAGVVALHDAGGFRESSARNVAATLAAITGER